MINVKFDASELVKAVQNIAEYSDGYINTLVRSEAYVNQVLGMAAVDALYSYLDARAQMDPGKLAHMYEPGELGDPDGRLFNFRVTEVGTYIEIQTDFLDSRQSPLKGGHVFTDRARIMEAGATITLRPRNGEVLAFEGDDGEMVFTASTVTIEHPGGPQAERGFADTVYEFFSSVATNLVIEPFVRRLASLQTYDRYFNTGARYGRSAGIQAAELQVKEAGNAFGF